MAAPLRVHVDVLGWLYIFWGLFGVLTGGSLLLLGAGTAAALWTVVASTDDAGAAVWILSVCGGALVLGGVAMAFAGRSLLRGQPGARSAVMVLGAVNLVFVPFGSALGVYAIWVLLNDDARRQFGRAPRRSGLAG